MPLPHLVARLNKRYTNRFIEPVVRRMSGYAVIHHTGRRSGRHYRTPVYAFGGDGDYLVSLTYGPGADWVQNMAARPAQFEQGDVVREIGRHAVVGRDRAWPHLPVVVRLALRLLRVTDFMHLRLVERQVECAVMAHPPGL